MTPDQAVKRPARRSDGAQLQLSASVLIALAVAAPCAADESGAELRTNPFIRPPLNTNVSGHTNATGPVRSKSPPRKLRLTLAAGPDSLVNVDGKILRIGEEINGYRLEAVREAAAIFSNGEQLIELRIRDGDSRKTK